MDWFDPIRLVTLALCGVFGVALARRRRESPGTIEMDVGGGLLFLIGLWWAASIGRDAATAALLAGLGGVSFTYALARHRRMSRQDGSRAGFEPPAITSGE
jgi:cyanate permease